MNEDLDQDWLAALAGRPIADSMDAREARELRGGILALASEPGAPCASEDPAREGELIERARLVGLIAARPDRAGVLRRQGRGASWLAWRGAFAAAALVAAGAIGLWLRPADEPATVRGNPDGVVRLEARDARAVQRRLIEQLREVGVPATGYEMLGRLGIDAELPQPVPAAVRRILVEHGIPLPQDGVLRVEIESVEGP